MELFYSETLIQENEMLIFDSDESRHIVRVLRKKIGDFIRVTNGQGLEWEGEIIATELRKVVAKKNNIILHQNKITPLHIAIAPTKSNDRMEWFLEKATEIGVTQITPILCQHSERKTLKIDRMKKILVGGLKQSAQFFLPQLNPIISFDDFIKSDPQGKRLIAHCQNEEKTTLHKIGNLECEIIIMIGPEGDFSNREVNTASEHSFKGISLGSQRLRTETAGIVACCMVATLREVLKK
jgi:16S rRNA (uracil1498-N3)-methyltransferase